ncbi:MAG: signal recognition particle [Candidatus Bathyarchaeota archaeon]|nr:signal recognition particle [Candidatus Bathyarchaeota archaeon]
MRKQKKTMIWPVYLDSSKTRRGGRKVPKHVGIPSPTAVEIQRAAENLGLEPEVESDRVHPKTPWKKSGRVWISRAGSKSRSFTDIAKEIVSMRQRPKS